MPSADKRQRKKENARMARQAREAAAKRRKRLRSLRNGSIVAVIVVGGVVLINLLTGGSSKKAAPTTTTVSTLPKPTCPTTKPPATPRPKNLKRPALTIDSKKTYTATMTTSCGTVVIALDAKNAPNGVNQFVYLARQGFYNGLTFHRAATNFMIQGGDPNANGTGSDGYGVTTELPKNGYPLGTLAWAKKTSDPAGASAGQFFIVTADRPASLEQKQKGSYQYGVFGHVTKGLDVAKKMEAFAPSSGDGRPTQTLYIGKVTITES